jgi:hypothetical protein
MTLNGSSAEGGFNVETLSAPSAAGAVYRIACPRMRDLASMDIQALGGMLATLIEAVDRGATSSATIVLDVLDCNIVPLYVDFAIGYLLERQVRTGVIVVCDDSTSHDDDSTLPKALRVNLSAANRQGSLWNPLHQRWVPARLGMDDGALDLAGTRPGWT